MPDKLEVEPVEVAVVPFAVEQESNLRRCEQPLDLCAVVIFHPWRSGAVGVLAPLRIRQTALAHPARLGIGEMQPPPARPKMLFDARDLAAGHRERRVDKRAKRRDDVELAGQAIEVLETLDPKELGRDALDPANPTHKLDIVGNDVGERHPSAHLCD